jgi:hypothetical protein
VTSIHGILLSINKTTLSIRDTCMGYLLRATRGHVPSVTLFFEGNVPSVTCKAVKNRVAWLRPAGLSSTDGRLARKPNSE